MNLKKTFRGKKVIVTGHPGFKGSWLTLWLTLLGAKVLGISLNNPTNPSHFKALNIKKNLKTYNIDIRNEKKLSKIIENYKPQYLFHLAAQSLVNKSYNEPSYTWQTNTFGTINILESLRKLKNHCVAVIITSDKVYKNFEIKRGYKENDRLGGIDPYSASKASAELALYSYIKSYFKKKSKVRIGIARAGNVIGGGDWSENRLIPDCIKSIKNKKKLLIRFPNSTRPWQHVFEAIYGYMLLALKQKKIKNINGNVFNFGPNNKSSITVIELVSKIKSKWDFLNWKIVKIKKNEYESKLLKLNSTKAFKIIKWKCYLNANQTIDLVINWYKYFLDKKKINMYKYSINQIKEFEKIVQKTTNTEN